jgi:hypothetical protein
MLGRVKLQKDGPLNSGDKLGANMPALLTIESYGTFVCNGPLATANRARQ